MNFLDIFNLYLFFFIFLYFLFILHFLKNYTQLFPDFVIPSITFRGPPSWILKRGRLKEYNFYFFSAFFFLSQNCHPILEGGSTVLLLLLLLLLRHAQATPPEFWNGLNRRALVELFSPNIGQLRESHFCQHFFIHIFFLIWKKNDFFFIFPDFFLLRMRLDWRALVELCPHNIRKLRG